MLMVFTYLCHKDLCTASLVCKLWREFCIPVIFQAVGFRVNGSLSMREVLEFGDEYGEYVVYMTFYGAYSLPFHNFQCFGESLGYSDELAPFWLAYLPALASRFPNTHSLHILRMTLLPFIPSAVNACKPIKWENIHSLSIQGSSLQPYPAAFDDLLSPFPSVRSLELAHNRWPTDDFSFAESRNVLSGLAQLQVLFLCLDNAVPPGHMRCRLSHIFSSGGTPGSLTSLDIGVAFEEDVEKLCDLLITSPSVKYLTIRLVGMRAYVFIQGVFTGIIHEYNTTLIMCAYSELPSCPAFPLQIPYHTYQICGGLTDQLLAMLGFLASSATLLDPRRAPTPARRRLQHSDRNRATCCRSKRADRYRAA